MHHHMPRQEHACDMKCLFQPRDRLRRLSGQTGPAMAPHLSGKELDQIQKLKNQPTTKILERLTKAREMVYLAISGLISALSSALSSALFGFV